ncbi:MAG: hypothetical protein OEW21_12505 [Betaproteobacteria bacterium]|nr:hypothetical protein [Betaproteobacteria bacterium]
MRFTWFVALLCYGAPSFAYDANGVELGATEAAVRKVFTTAHCKELEWKSAAADRRCDNSRIRYAGVSARITLYLSAGALRAFDVRFDAGDLPRVVEFLTSRHGAPAEDLHETYPRRDQTLREVHRLRWRRGTDRLELISRPGNRRAQIFVSRGDVSEDLYRIR